MVITGGEPLLYKDSNKTLLDIWKKFPKMFFMFYTNGTLISKEVAEKFAELSNVSPAISIEGFEKETDERRGKGVFKKILQATENLKKVGVPFGVSVTATSKNFDTIMKDEFWDFVFKELGATYAWIFQIMPIGCANDAKELMITPEQRVKLYRKWEYLIKDKKYCVADFWNSGILSNGCIAYGRSSGYFYIDWNGNIMPCVFVPYYTDNVFDLYKNNKKLEDALFSDFFKKGRKWQDGYGYDDSLKKKNWLMPCSIRDHWINFKGSIMTKNVKTEDLPAAQTIKSEEYSKILEDFDKELEKLTQPIWDKEFLGKR